LKKFTFIQGKDQLDNDFAAYIESRLLTEKEFQFRGGAQESEIAAWIRRNARIAKETLSGDREYEFNPQVPGIDIPSLNLTRMELEAVFTPLMSIFESCVRATLREAKLKQSNADISVIMQEDIRTIGEEVDFVVLAGGMSRIPFIETKLAEIMPKARIGFVSTAENSTTAIVEGVSNLGEFSGLNVHRPSFYLVVNWKTPQGEAREECIYRAFQPLYSDDQLNRRETLLGMDLDFTPRSDASKGFHLEIQTVGGKTVSFTVDGKQTASIPLSADRNSTIKIKLYMDGKLNIRDALGQDLRLRIREWPVLRWGSTGRKMQPLRIETEEASFNNISTNHWDLFLD
jgi:molecular chaperone DnaK (HSP70)